MFCLNHHVIKQPLRLRYPLELGVTVIAVLNTKIHLLWLLAMGATLGLMGWVLPAAANLNWRSLK